LTSGKEQLIEFFAFWDPTSKSMATVVHDLEIHYQDRIHFIYLDIDDPATSEFKKALGYKYPPHFFLVNGEGEVLQQWIGFVTKYEFEDAFALIP
jgi:thiol-disulfide isomerase/thioredoxin